MAVEKKRFMDLLFRSELMTTRMPPIPLSPYSQEDLLQTYTSVTACYAGRVADMMKGARAFTPREAQGGIELNPPAVETIKWEEIKPFFSSERWEVVNIILEPQKFRNVVLNSLQETENLLDCRPTLIAKQIEDQLIRLRYIERLHEDPKCICPLFLVPRPDGKYRVIWDGRLLNERCKKPPTFHLRNVIDHLQWLLSPDIEYLISFDMKSWFVQLTPHKEIKRFFVSKIHGKLYIIMGIPMGWTWAPIIAQFVAEAIAAAISTALPHLDGFILVYIDNFMMAIRYGCRYSKEEIISKIQEVCSRIGAVIKEGSLKWGRVLEWLGTEIDLNSMRYRLKEKFVEKFADVVRPHLGQWKQGIQSE